MTRTSIREYTEAVRWRYLRSPKTEKGKILDEFAKVTGYQLKTAIRLLHQTNKPVSNKKRGRRRRYSAAEVGALRVAWEATDCLCSKQLQPFLPELVKVLRRHGETAIPAEVEARLCQMSASTIDRLLKPWRRLGGRRPLAPPSRPVCSRVPSLFAPLLTGQKTDLVFLRLTWYPTVVRVPQAST